MIRGIRNREIATLWITLNSEEINSLRGAKFAFAVAKNRTIVKPIIEALKAVQDQGVEIAREFNERRVALCMELADKNEDGNPVIIGDREHGGEFMIEKRRSEFDSRFSDLMEKYSDEIEAKKRFNRELVELLEKEEEIDLHMVVISDVPDDISVSTMSGLEPMILDE